MQRRNAAIQRSSNLFGAFTLTKSIYPSLALLGLSPLTDHYYFELFWRSYWTVSVCRVEQHAVVQPLQQTEG